jgi:DNA polymerase-3 subunit delta
MPLYWILGQEPLQRCEHCTQIYAQVAKQYPTYQRHTFTLKVVKDWQDLRDASLEWSDLFSDHHLIECEIQAKIPKEGFSFLQQWVARQSTETSLLLMIDKPDWIKASDYQPLLKSGITYWAKTVLPKDFTNWLKNHAKKKGLRLAQDALLCLARYTEGNLLAAHQVLEKLRILKQGIITEQEVVQYLTFQIQSSVFDLAEAMIAGDTEKTFRILATLCSEGVEPHLVLWALTREVRTIIHIATAIQSGMPLHVACESVGAWQSRAAKYGQALNLVPLHRFYTLLTQAQNIDRIIKGLDPGNPYEAIGQWLLTLDRWLNKDRCFVA